jgi:hypothetical protein
MPASLEAQKQGNPWVQLPPEKTTIPPIMAPNVPEHKVTIVKLVVWIYIGTRDANLLNHNTLGFFFLIVVSALKIIGELQYCGYRNPNKRQTTYELESRQRTSYHPQAFNNRATSGNRDE